MANRPTVARLHISLVGVVVLLVAVFVSPGTALAHTDFESSTPSDGSIVDGPLTTVVVEFTNPAVSSGEGFRLLDPDGVVREPASLDPTDGTTFIATFDPPLGDGEYGFRWDVQAGDAHPIQGSFRFTVIVPVSVTDAAPGTVAVDHEVTTAPATVTPADETGGVSDDTSTLDEFLVVDDDSGTAVGRIGRSMTMAGTVFAVGIVTALAAFVRGRRDELHALIGWVRVAGLAIVAGGVVEFAALDETQSAGAGEVLGSRPGTAVLLKVVAGVLVFVGFGDHAGEIVGRPRSLSAGAALETAERSGAAAGSPFDAGLGWRPGATAAVGLAGLTAAMASFWFDGHTVSRGPWLVHAIVNLVHVGAAAVWVGGVFAMTAVAVLRRSHDEPTGLAAMVVRFSAIAAGSLCALAVAGLVMAWMVIDGLTDLWSSDWGRVLIDRKSVV